MLRFIAKLVGRNGSADTQVSLFHYIKSKDETVEQLSWSELLALIKPDFKEPQTQASLFNYIRRPEEEVSPTGEVQISAKVLEQLSQRPKGLEPNLISSLFADPSELEQQVKQMRRRRLATALTSALLHVGVIALIVLVAVLSRANANKGAKKPEQQVVMIAPVLPPLVSDGTNKSGGGGGGGGKRELAPPSGGRIPKTRPVQLAPPEPKPMERPDETFLAEQSVVVPIEIPQNEALPIGDITQPPAPASSGPGAGGGVGVGSGSGIGPGKGPGVGPGSGGGIGGGRGGGVGPGEGSGIYSAGMAGLRNPELIYQPLPPYTEEARKNRIEGAVLLEVIVRKDGTIDSPQIVRALGYGLDESAVKTVMTKWKFKPGTKDGQPVDVRALIEVYFRLL